MFAMIIDNSSQRRGMLFLHRLLWQNAKGLTRFDQLLRASCESAVAMASAVPGQWLYRPHCQCEELIGPLQGKMGERRSCMLQLPWKA